MSPIVTGLQCAGRGGLSLCCSAAILLKTTPLRTLFYLYTSISWNIRVPFNNRQTVKHEKKLLKQYYAKRPREEKKRKKRRKRREALIGIKGYFLFFFLIKIHHHFGEAILGGCSWGEGIIIPSLCDLIPTHQAWHVVWPSEKLREVGDNGSSHHLMFVATIWSSKVYCIWIWKLHWNGNGIIASSSSWCFLLFAFLPLIWGPKLTGQCSHNLSIGRSATWVGLYSFSPLCGPGQHTPNFYLPLNN